MAAFGRLLLLAILQDDRQLYGVERLFDTQQFENLELAVSAKGSRHYPISGLHFFSNLVIFNSGDKA